MSACWVVERIVVPVDADRYGVVFGGVSSGDRGGVVREAQAAGESVGPSSLNAGESAGQSSLSAGESAGHSSLNAGDSAGQSSLNAGTAVGTVADGSEIIASVEDCIMVERAPAFRVVGKIRGLWQLMDLPLQEYIFS
ncbi:hypothetical protein B0T26DRAFT_719721 [Lasiosphaeria miniovina]|uniref:Uncharacterized protein n=1 Tax=Lasiosphaeria miniovina TaxID=1954250 RepID=A0AA40AE57_9PEZI|nr:uncharacterized protein B0T26DRAFT_719721 [Lasiosphaeria miniovina]KAK0714167.1 hypothetical protein B0T26DRAFT_719721 [Lasiosphaeria miniovina]